MQSINLLTHQWAQENLNQSRFFPETTSTNDVAREEFPKLEVTEALYLTDHQTQGRGRDGRGWQNMSGGEVLLSTWCFKVDHPVQPSLTPLLGLGLYKSLKALKPSIPLRLKAPNDIFLNSGKLCGLLVEVSSQGDDTFVYIGLGMNIFAAPNIDIMTSHLKEEIDVNMNDWFKFCEQFMSYCRSTLEDSRDFELSENQRKELLEALNQRLPESEKYTQVHPNCDLETLTERISWMDL